MQSITTNGAGSNTSPVLEVEDSKTCEQCGTAFSPRAGNGGKPQRFCGPDCRQAFHSEARAIEPQRDQRAPTCSALVTLTATPEAPSQENAPAESSEDFDWSDSESVILPEQPATACYFNPKGDLVIRQRNWPDGDSLILISANMVDQFLDKLTDACGIPSFGGPSK